MANAELCQFSTHIGSACARQTKMFQDLAADLQEVVTKLRGQVETLRRERQDHG